MLSFSFFPILLSALFCCFCKMNQKIWNLRKKFLSIMVYDTQKYTNCSKSGLTFLGGSSATTSLFYTLLCCHHYHHHPVTLWETSQLLKWNLLFKNVCHVILLLFSLQFFFFFNWKPLTTTVVSEIFFVRPVLSSLCHFSPHVNTWFSVNFLYIYCFCSSHEFLFLFHFSPNQYIFWGNKKVKCYIMCMHLVICHL